MSFENVINVIILLALINFCNPLIPTWKLDENGIPFFPSNSQNYKEIVACNDGNYKLKIKTPEIQRKNIELQNLENQILIENQNINMFITQNQNIATAESLRIAKELAEKIDKQKNIVDTDIADLNAKFNREVYDNVNTTSATLNDSVAKNFGANSDGLGDDEAEIAYQRAVESNLIDEVEDKQQNRIEEKK